MDVQDQLLAASLALQNQLSDSHEKLIRALRDHVASPGAEPTVAIADNDEVYAQILAFADQEYVFDERARTPSPVPERPIAEAEEVFEPGDCHGKRPMRGSRVAVPGKSLFLSTFITRLILNLLFILF